VEKDWRQFAFSRMQLRTGAGGWSQSRRELDRCLVSQRAVWPGRVVINSPFLDDSPGISLADSKVGTFTQALYNEAKSNGWTVISMKKDWKRILS
jgi:hypothetical protein